MDFLRSGNFLRMAWLLVLCLGWTPWISAQEVVLKGCITDTEGRALAGATVHVRELDLGAPADSLGCYRLGDLPQRNLQVEIRFTGYRTITRVFDLGQKAIQDWSPQMQPDMLKLEEAVVTGTRSEVPVYDAPVIVNRVSAEQFEMSQALHLAEGIDLSPGLRTENNCQNCGFTQLRMNGLGGAYSQILINSRPVFSALAGVYGLEMIPANMIDRVEIVRGAGSALYGGNAIAGTVNIITRDPQEPYFEVGAFSGSIRGEASDYMLSAQAQVVSDDRNQGVSLFGNRRNRDAWDANADGFTEMVRLRNQTFGINSFMKPHERSRLDLNLYTIQEHRRGGAIEMERPPHQVALAEALDHRIFGAALQYRHWAEDTRQNWNLYTSMQSVNRDSYYGAGGRPLGPGQSLTTTDRQALNAYGASDDLSWVSGGRYRRILGSDWEATLGAEWQYNGVEDAMPGYGRLIDQQVHTVGAFGQLQYQPHADWTVLAGSRLDHIDIRGRYVLEQSPQTQSKQLQPMAPRLSVQYRMDPTLQFRAGYAQGFRAPQAFDEDLHIATVGGAAQFIRLDEELQTERSHSYQVSADYRPLWEKVQANFITEFFWTDLERPFITADAQALPSGISTVLKKNGSGARVMGMNWECNLAWSSDLKASLGGTLQRARYRRPEVLWAPGQTASGDDREAVTTQNILRTPDDYGYVSFQYTPNRWALSAQLRHTGPMDIAHVVEPSSEYTIVKRSPSFFVVGWKAAYSIALKDPSQLQLFAGVKNLLDAYQADFDRGVDRDAGYVYGPAAPRTWYGGLRWMLGDAEGGSTASF